MAMEGGRFSILSTVRLFHLEKWTFLIAWIKVLWTGLNSVAWYPYTSSVLVFASREFNGAGFSGLVGGLVFWLG